LLTSPLPSPQEREFSPLRGEVERGLFIIRSFFRVLSGLGLFAIVLLHFEKELD
jgi:hypothetical protein